MQHQSFPQYYVDRTLPVTRAAIGTGLLLVIAITVIDVLLMPKAFSEQVVPLRMMTMVVPLLGALGATFLMSKRRWLPHLLLSVAMLAWFARIGASGEVWSIIIAHTVLTAPFAMAVIRLRLNQIDTNLKSAAWNLGASEWTAMREVIIPFVKPAILSSLCLTAAVSFDEFAVAWFVSGLNKTVPVIILEIVTGNIDPQVNAIGTFVFITSMTLVIMAQVLIMTRERKDAPA